MAIQAVGALLSGAVRLMSGAGNLSSVIRIGNKVFRKLDNNDSDNVLIPQVDVAATRRSMLGVQRNLNQISETPNKMALEHLRREAAQIAGKFAQNTPPLNTSLSNAEAKVEADINKIFKPLQDIPFGELVMARNFSAALAYNFNFESASLREAMNDQNWSLVFGAFERSGWAAKPMAVSIVSKPSKSLHRQGRGANGVVKKTFHISGPKDDAKRQIDEYVAQAKKAIGKMAGGWVRCYVGLKGNGMSFPSNYSMTGDGSFKIVRGREPAVMIKNKYANFNGYMSKSSSKFNKIIEHGQRKVLTNVTKDLMKEFKKRGIETQ